MTFNRRELLQSLPLALTGVGVRLSSAAPGGRRRARELGIRIGQMTPGRWNAITDVPGVEGGHTTLIRGEGKLVVGQGPVRTGVTAIWPQREILTTYLPCGYDMPNANGEVSGLRQIDRLGILASPICLTNTSSVGMVYDAVLAMVPRDELPAVEPVVGETWDAWLNDTEGRHVRAAHVAEALRQAKSGPVAEGAVGGGTGMITYGFKGGIGTASRILPEPLERFTVGVLVQANHGDRAQLRIDGVPVGEVITDLRPVPDWAAVGNSILIVIATDAPLLDHQLSRLARRGVHGLAKTGSTSGNSSGDFTLAFSTANRIPRRDFWLGPTYSLRSVEQFDLDPAFEAAAEATEEAIINALFMAGDMEGVDGHKVYGIPLERTREIMRRHHRVFAAAGGEGSDVSS
jgi:D-aminopeptidase